MTYDSAWLRARESAMISGADAARVLGVDSRTIGAMVERGEIRGRKSLRRYLVSVQSLLEFIDRIDPE